METGKNKLHPPYRLVNGVRHVKINNGWVNSAVIESILKPEEGPVIIRTITGATHTVHGVYSTDALHAGIFGNRNDPPEW
jgi:hypothetical protein